MTWANTVRIEGQGASIGDVPPHIKGDQLFEDDPVEHIEDSPDLPPIWQVFGGSKRAAEKVAASVMIEREGVAGSANE